MASKRAIVIDGNSLLYRNYYATQSQAEWAIEHGLQPMNAVLSMAKACLELREMADYDYCLIAFDHWEENFRHAEFASYKAGRAKMPDALVSQLQIVDEVLNLLGYNTKSLPTFEADDLAGSFCRIMNEVGTAVTVYTSDHDLLQLVNPLTEVCIIQKGIVGTYYNDENFAELSGGLNPRQIPDFKGLAGDSSDRLPGVPGIGKKTAQQLLGKYGTIEQIYEHIDQLPPGIAKKLSVNVSSAHLCKKLATIQCNLFEADDPQIFQCKSPDWDALEILFERYGVKNARITRSSNRYKPS